MLEDGIAERRYQGSREDILKADAQGSLRNTTRGSWCETRLKEDVSRKV